MKKEIINPLDSNEFFIDISGSGKPTYHALEYNKMLLDKLENEITTVHAGNPSEIMVKILNILFESKNLPQNKGIDGKIDLRELEKMIRVEREFSKDNQK
ncbi:hypothetical protein [Bacillus altitudinis]|uniref:hypothetical protein n=1 Tax=Bacillus altitudinis TaxID=293387 RepID=UPI0039BF664C